MISNGYPVAGGNGAVSAWILSVCLFGEGRGAVPAADADKVQIVRGEGLNYNSRYCKEYFQWSSSPVFLVQNYFLFK